MSQAFSLRRLALALPLLSLLLATAVWGGGTPDPSNVALSTTNRNQLLGILGPDRGFGFGDYVTDRVSGLQRLGATVPYRYFIEVPPDELQLVVEIFDAEVGGGDNLGTPAVNEDLHDQDNTTAGYAQTLIYSLINPDGVVVQSVTLTGQDCDPAVAGIQTFCDNTWSNLGVFTVANPAPGHWLMTVASPNSGNNDEDDANSFGIRAHDGDATAGGTEFNVYADTFIGLGQVYSATAAADPGLSRVYDIFPFIRRDCTCESNDWDSDSSAPIDESTIFLTRKGITPTGSNGTLSGATLWRQNALTNFSSPNDATDYGLWRLVFTTGRFNHLTYYMGDETNFDPSNAAPGPGNGQEPNQQPEAGSIRMYLPADGSRFFGLDGGPNDVIVPPVKPWVGQSWALLPGEPPVEANVTSIARVTITVSNPTDNPIQFSSTTAGPNVIVATLPASGTEISYVAGSAAITGGSSTAVNVAGTGPWTFTFAPGVIAANTTATLTYDVSITPTPVGLPKSFFLTGQFGTATAGSYIDETCADGAGGASICSATALATANLSIGPLCRLFVTVTSAPAIGVAKRINGTVTDNGNGTFNVPFRLVVENLGTEVLNPVSVIDNLAATFPAPATFTIAAAPSTSILSGVGTLTGNAGYNGNGNNDLLSAGSLNPGAVGQIDFTVTLDPNGLPGPFLNQATASGDTPLGGTVDDTSDDGTDPDTDGDGNADEDAGGICPSTLPANNCENDPTPISFGENPVIGIAKQLSGPVVDNGNGTYTVGFNFRLENLGNVDLTLVQATDSLATALPAPVTITAVSAVTAGMVSGSGTLTANPAYNGVGNTNLLVAASSNLTVGAVGSISFSVTFDPNGQIGPFNNQAAVSATSPLGATPTDSSDDGTDPDPNGNGDPDEVGENDPTPFGVPESPRIGVAKRVNGTVVNNGNGTYTVSLVFVVENLGNVALSSVQVVDDLVATFPAPASVVAAGPPVASILSGSGTLTANAGFNGTGNNNLLTAASSNLAVGAVGQITLSVTFDPDTNPGPFLNTVVASGASPSSTVVTDQSDDGTDPDTDGDGDADEDGAGCPSSDPGTNCENDPTPIAVPGGLVARVGLAKSASEPVDNGNGTYTVTITLIVENLGNRTLSAVEVVDDLAATFPAPAAVVSVSLPVASILSGSGNFNVNPAYDGVTDTVVVLDSSSLEIASVAQIDFDVTFDPADQTTFFNSATVDGNNGITGDTSDDGNDPDPDGDGEPNEAGENDPTPIVVGAPVLEVPSLDGIGRGLLALVLALAGWVLLRRFV